MGSGFSPLFTSFASVLSLVGQQTNEIVPVPMSRQLQQFPPAVDRKVLKRDVATICKDKGPNAAREEFKSFLSPRTLQRWIKNYQQILMIPAGQAKQGSPRKRKLTDEQELAAVRKIGGGVIRHNNDVTRVISSMFGVPVSKKYVRSFRHRHNIITTSSNVASSKLQGSTAAERTGSLYQHVDVYRSQHAEGLCAVSTDETHFDFDCVQHKHKHLAPRQNTQLDPIAGGQLTIDCDSIRLHLTGSTLLTTSITHAFVYAGVVYRQPQLDKHEFIILTEKVHHHCCCCCWQS